jgi:hypothetical protein
MFKLSECIGVFGYYIGGLIDYTDRKTEKCQECTNMGQDLRSLLYGMSLPELDV